jgi:hypothetical protein
MEIDAGELLQLRLLREVQEDLDEWSTREGDGKVSRNDARAVFHIGIISKSRCSVKLHCSRKQAWRS